MSLCSGYGGLDLALGLALPDARTVCYVEREVSACQVLAAAMEAGALEPAPIWSDLRTFDGMPWRGRVRILSAGYPCQPFSLAGKRAGSADERHLFPQVARIVGEVRPPLVFLENVPGHLNLGFEEVCESLQELGYRFEAGLFTAEEVGAPHKRERLFVVAYNNNNGREGFGRSGLLDRERAALGHDADGCRGSALADSLCTGLAGWTGLGRDARAERPSVERGGYALANALGSRHGGGAPDARRGSLERTSPARASQANGRRDLADPCGVLRYVPATGDTDGTDGGVTPCTSSLSLPSWPIRC